MSLSSSYSSSTSLRSNEVKDDDIIWCEARFGRNEELWSLASFESLVLKTMDMAFFLWNAGEVGADPVDTFLELGPTTTKNVKKGIFYFNYLLIRERKSISRIFHKRGTKKNSRRRCRMIVFLPICDILSLKDIDSFGLGLRLMTGVVVKSCKGTRI